MSVDLTHEKQTLTNTITRILEHLHSNSPTPELQSEICGSFMKDDLQKLLSQLEDQFFQLRVASAQLLCEFLFNNFSYQQRFCELLDISMLDGPNIESDYKTKTIPLQQQQQLSTDLTQNRGGTLLELPFCWYITSDLAQSGQFFPQWVYRSQLSIPSATSNRNSNCSNGSTILAAANNNNNSNPKSSSTTNNSLNTYQQMSSSKLPFDPLHALFGIVIKQSHSYLSDSNAPVPPVSLMQQYTTTINSPNGTITPNVAPNMNIPSKMLSPTTQTSSYAKRISLKPSQISSQREQSNTATGLAQKQGKERDHSSTLNNKSQSLFTSYNQLPKRNNQMCVEHPNQLSSLSQTNICTQTTTTAMNSSAICGISSGTNSNRNTTALSQGHIYIPITSQSSVAVPQSSSTNKLNKKKELTLFEFTAAQTQQIEQEASIDLQQVSSPNIQIPPKEQNNSIGCSIPINVTANPTPATTTNSTNSTGNCLVLKPMTATNSIHSSSTQITNKIQNNIKSNKYFVSPDQRVAVTLNNKPSRSSKESYPHVSPSRLTITTATTSSAFGGSSNSTSKSQFSQALTLAQTASAFSRKQSLTHNTNFQSHGLSHNNNSNNANFASTLTNKQQYANTYSRIHGTTATTTTTAQSTTASPFIRPANNLQTSPTNKSTCQNQQSLNNFLRLSAVHTNPATTTTAATQNSSSNLQQNIQSSEQKTHELPVNNVNINMQNLISSTGLSTNMYSPKLSTSKHRNSSHTHSSSTSSHSMQNHNPQHQKSFQFRNSMDSVFSSRLKNSSHLPGSQSPQNTRRISAFHSNMSQDLQNDSSSQQIIQMYSMNEVGMNNVSIGQLHSRNSCNTNNSMGSMQQISLSKIPVNTTIGTATIPSSTNIVIVTQPTTTIASNTHIATTQLAEQSKNNSKKSSVHSEQQQQQVIQSNLKASLLQVQVENNTPHISQLISDPSSLRSSQSISMNFATNNNNNHEIIPSRLSLTNHPHHAASHSLSINVTQSSTTTTHSTLISGQGSESKFKPSKQFQQQPNNHSSHQQQQLQQIRSCRESSSSSSTQSTVTNPSKENQSNFYKTSSNYNTIQARRNSAIGTGIGCGIGTSSNMSYSNNVNSNNNSNTNNNTSNVSQIKQQNPIKMNLLTASSDFSSNTHTSSSQTIIGPYQRQRLSKGDGGSLLLDQLKKESESEVKVVAATKAKSQSVTQPQQQTKVTSLNLVLQSKQNRASIDISSSQNNAGISEKVKTVTSPKAKQQASTHQNSISEVLSSFPTSPSHSRKANTANPIKIFLGNSSTNFASTSISTKANEDRAIVASNAIPAGRRH